MESKQTITIYDAVMGSGKTTFIIQHMNSNPQHKYIYITPNLDECQRIAEACPKLGFKHPSDTKGTKLKDLQRLVELEENIVSTHAMLTNFTAETIELLYNRDYHLILDEAIDPCVEYNIKATDIRMLFDSGSVTIAEDGMTLVWCKEAPEYNSKFYQEYKLIENGNLVLFDFNGSSNDKKVFIWEMTKGLFESFHSVTILTYQFEGSILRSYFDLKGIDYHIDTKTLNRGLKLGHLINIYEGDDLNLIGSHYNSLASKLKRDPIKSKELGKNIYNYFRNKIGVSSQELLWTTFKEAVKYVKGKGFTKGFVVHNQKATNKYASKTTLAYALNLYMPVPVKRYLETRGVEVNEDIWSLNEMLQWIFRSAIRVGRPINIYVPNVRMRGLLTEWIKEH